MLNMKTLFTRESVKWALENAKNNHVGYRLEKQWELPNAAPRPLFELKMHSAKSPLYSGEAPTEAMTFFTQRKSFLLNLLTVGLTCTSSRTLLYLVKDMNLRSISHSNVARQSLRASSTVCSGHKRLHRSGIACRTICLKCFFFAIL